MGLDIHLTFIEEEEIHKSKDYFDIFMAGKFSVSRTFCNFMCRKDVIEGKPELNQIGEITGCNIDFLYDMTTYSDSFELEEMIDVICKSEEEKEQTRIEAKLQNNTLTGNIKDVKNKLILLIDTLSGIGNLKNLLITPQFDTLNHETYFDNFDKEDDENYTVNNFGQDLRNLLTHISFAIEHGAKTAYFYFG